LGCVRKAKKLTYFHAYSLCRATFASFSEYAYERSTARAKGEIAAAYSYRMTCIRAFAAWLMAIYELE